MLEYKKQSFSTWYGNRKWKKVNYNNTKHHIDFKKFTYKIGHKIFHGRSDEVQNAFKTELAQHEVWLKLSQKGA